MSADGRYVVFESDASNLVPGDGNAFTDIFVRDRQTGTTEIVSVSTLGAQADGRSYEPAITPDGRYVVFTSEATTLLDGGGDTNGRNDVFLRDRLFRTTERVSISSAEDQGTGPSGGGFSVGISDDGRFVVFPSHARNFAPGGVSNGFEQIYVRDRCVSNGNPVDGCIPGTVRVSESTAGDEGNSTSQRPVISGNGRFVAFESDAWNLVPGDTSPFDFPPGHRDVFVHDLQGTHRDEYFYTTDPTLRPSHIVSLFTGRWSIEVTFQEVRAHVGFTTPRSWSAKSVLRTAPCLLGLFSVVSLIFARHIAGQPLKLSGTGWYAKKEAAFSDAITVVRRLCWEPVLKQSWNHAGVTILPRRLRLTLLDHLSRAA